MKEATERFTSTHKLDFEVADWPHDKNFKCFRVGTCEGLFCTTKNILAILAINNKDKGNGHFNDVIEWFENSCKMHKVDFMILEVWNKKLKNHLIEKRGFIIHGADNVIKKFSIQ